MLFLSLCIQEQRELQQKMFGTMKPIPREEYMQIYQSTGIDIDGRREMIKHMIPCIEKAIKRFITFAKALPGFKDLPIDDQISLIKGEQRLDSWEMGRFISEILNHVMKGPSCKSGLVISVAQKVCKF